MSNATPPSEEILTTLQALVDAVSEEDYETAAEKSSLLLRKKKALDSSLTFYVQRVFLQSYLHLEQYAKVIDWCEQYNENNSHTDLKLYAQYRLEDYNAVGKQASKETVFEKHLLAQSYFHVQQVTSALKIYQELLDNSSDSEENRLEIITNALSTLMATVVPFVGVSATSEGDLLLTQAEELLGNNPECSDLALNLGTLMGLQNARSGSKWLDHAEENCDEDDDLYPIQANRKWNDQFWLENVDEIRYKLKQEKDTSPQAAIAQLNQCLIDQKEIASKPHPKWNSLQLKLYWYNRAVTQYKAGVDCQESCQSLRKLLSAAGKKKKNKQTPTDLWWDSRVEVLLARRANDPTKLEQVLGKLQQQPEDAAIDHAIAHVQLHLYALTASSSSSTNGDKEKLQSLLKSLPKSMQSRPAVVATLESMDGNQKKAATSSSKKVTADIFFGQGKYQEATDLYLEQLPEPSQCNEDQLAQHLRLVQALAILGRQQQASDLWESLQPYLEADVITESSNAYGEALELQALPRSSTTSTSSSVGPSSATSESSKKPKRSLDRVMRRRARKRESYIEKLKEKGEYNPNSKPNAERWIPKHERSRGRRGGRSNRSAQGGGSQSDSQRLDAAARRAGKIPASAGPSTANLKVSTGGRKGGRRR